MSKRFYLFAILAIFFTAGEYAITRPASHSLFLSHFAPSALPFVWLLTVPLNFLVVSLYNWLFVRFGPLVVMTLFAFAISLFNSLLPFFPSSPLVFLHYAWKDIYILLIFKQIWSLIHSASSEKRPRVLYGILFSGGTIGSIIGALLPTFLATRLGTESLFFFTLPLYSLLLMAYRGAHALHPVTDYRVENRKVSESFALFRSNQTLVGVLILVVAMQVSVAFFEYQFNQHLFKALPVQDERTSYVGWCFGLTNVATLFLQFFGGVLLLPRLGFFGAHLSVPVLLAGAAALQILFPTFIVATFGIIAIKAIDFSFFSVLREMLYAPLKLDEKYRAKAIIDVLAHRSSKAFASLLLLGLSAPFIAPFALSVPLFWIGSLFLMQKQKVFTYGSSFPS
jgi:AAA family ATP:ADP antiporter